MANPRCSATVTNAKAARHGEQCMRRAVTGSELCAVHGGIEDVNPPSKDPLIDRKRCTAHRRNGDPCKKWAIKGGVVCPTHGGSSPFVREAAKNRLLAMVNPAMAELHDIISRSNVTDSDKLRAIGMVLNRTGFTEKVDVSATVEVKPWEGLVQGILRTVEDEADEIVIEPRGIAAAPADDANLPPEAHLAIWSAHQNVDQPVVRPQPIVRPGPTGSSTPPRWAR